MDISQYKINLFQTLENIFGKELVRKLYIQSCIKLYERKEIIFIHIPKAGGSSISRILYGKRVGHASASTIKTMMGEKVFSKIFSFAVTRNPYDRIVSSYHYAIQGGGTNGGIRNPKMYRIPEFNSFESFVSKWLINQDQNQLDVIFRPQHKFVCDEDNNILINWLGKIEELYEVEYMLRNRLDGSYKISRMNNSLHKEYFHYYNDNLQEIIYNYYERDFILFKYRKEL